MRIFHCFFRGEPDADQLLVTKFALSSSSSASRKTNEDKDEGDEMDDSSFAPIGSRATDLKAALNPCASGLRRYTPAT
jgi:hypothetical protein